MIAQMRYRRQGFQDGWAHSKRRWYELSGPEGHPRKVSRTLEGVRIGSKIWKVSRSRDLWSLKLGEEGRGPPSRHRKAGGQRMEPTKKTGWVARKGIRVQEGLSIIK